MHSINYFSVARTEKAQDEFLEWLFCSYKSDEIKSVVVELISSIVEEKGVTEIKDLKVKSQYKMDVGIPDLVIGVKTNVKDYIIVIEDKINAVLNNNLESYNNYAKDNAASITKKLGIKLDNPTVKLAVIRTGNHSENEKRNCKYTYLDRSDLIVVLENSGNVFIEEFVSNLKPEKLIEYKSKKPLIAERLSSDFGFCFKFCEKDGRILFQVKGNPDVQIKVNICSLEGGKIHFEATSNALYSTHKASFKVLNLVKNSKKTPRVIGNKKETCMTYNDLTDKIKDIIEDVKTGMLEQ